MKNSISKPFRLLLHASRVKRINSTRKPLATFISEAVAGAKFAQGNVTLSTFFLRFLIDVTAFDWFLEQLALHTPHEDAKN